MSVRERQVAVYARVSTEHEAQLSALENQVQYYENILKMHPEWNLYKYYIDEGITGTSVKKRKNFMQMMDDAVEGKFDLIITREVSRFARNTVDTLQQTRMLKKHGVEVYFTEDNIWTMNDEDGELRLTIMATLAQNESKKTSIRVKAGQAVSFQNGVAYGNGNILGYDRDGKGFVINEEQAKTVRMIYDLYLQGYGIRKIQFELEKRERLTAMGLKNWSCSCISRILNNAFYCGTVVYRKQFVPDYLEQKKVNNYDYVNKVVVEGSHEPIITKEEFERVQEILATKTASRNNRGARGKHTANDVWCKKLKCSCGASFNRRVWHRVNGIPQYAYQCYHQIKTGTVATRIKKGLSIEGVCETPMIPAWKLEVMASLIFQKFWKDKTTVIQIANEMLEKHIGDDRDMDFADEIAELHGEIEKYKRKYDNLVDMRMADEITREIFLEKKQFIEAKIESLQNQLSNYEIKVAITDEELERKLKVLQYGLQQDFEFSARIPESIIDAFVNEIIPCKDYFIWKLCFTDDDIRCLVEGHKNNASVSLVDTPNIVDGSTGCYQSKVGECYLFSVKLDFEKAKEYRKSYGAYLRKNQWNDIEVDVCMLI